MLEQFLTFQCRLFNSSHAASLGALYGCEYISKQYKFKIMQSWAVVEIKPPAP